MFQQIDVDGSHSVTWEEFSNFCVDAGFVAQAGGRVTSEVSTKYVHRTAYRDRHMHVPSVRGMEIFRIEGYSILAVVEPQAPILRMYLVRSAPEQKTKQCRVKSFTGGASCSTATKRRHTSRDRSLTTQ